MREITGTQGVLPSRRLAAIMFTDLVGYSALAHRDEALAIELLELHRGWVRQILPQHGGIEIETVGDAFLIEFSSALAAVDCALAIQNRFAVYNASVPEQRRMQLRIGIHVCDIEHRDDNVMGDGVNIASRIHGMAQPGGICVSEDVHRVVRNRPGLRMQSLGTPALKNIATKMELFSIEAGDGGTVRSSTRIGWRVPALVAAAGLLAVTVAGLVWLREPALPADEMPSVAVLPFVNLSADQDNGYFTDGVHDAILTHLSRVRGLKVISRTSVMEYKGTARNLRKIGRDLGVAHVVEGSVQRAGNRVRVNAQLIRVADDGHVWAEIYDRDLADVFAIQSDVAQKIVDNVEASLTANEQQQILAQPTTDSLAYDLYLRGHEFGAQEDHSRQSTEKALDYFARAISADPEFAPSHAAASRMHSQMYWFDYDRSAVRLQLAEREATEALRLAPDLAETHMALGYLRYYGSRDYEEALRHFRKAVQLQPGSADVFQALGYIERRQGSWKAAIAHLRRAIELDPLDRLTRRTLADTLYMNREYREADRAYQGLLLLAPDFHSAVLARPLLQVAWHGDLSQMAQLAPSLKAGEDQEGDAVYALYQYSLWARKPDQALKVLQATSLNWLRVLNYALGTNARYPKSLLEALALRYQGKPAEAKARFEAALAAIGPELGRDSSDARQHAAMAIALAGIGRDAEAIAAARKAVELLPSARDAIVGPQMVQALATVLAWSGDARGAVRELEGLLSAPSGITTHLLELDPRWDSIRSDPGFARLIADHAPPG